MYESANLSSECCSLSDRVLGFRFTCRQVTVRVDTYQDRPEVRFKRGLLRVTLKPEKPTLDIHQEGQLSEAAHVRRPAVFQFGSRFAKQVWPSGADPKAMI